MKKFASLLIIGCLISNYLLAQGDSAAYKRAEKYIHYNIDKLVKNLELRPNWIDEGSDFWYKTQTEQGYKFLLSNSKKGKTTDAFDHQKMAEKLSEQLNKNVLKDSLPLKEFKYINERSAIEFEIDSIKYTVHLKNYTVKKEPKE
ncbi:MAG: hypothetical protein P1P88_26180, partial [Bacteroidales bacterium]|nr:hypothetical protein [Bacteroidales bacterium]